MVCSRRLRWEIASLSRTKNNLLFAFTSLPKQWVQLSNFTIENSKMHYRLPIYHLALRFCGEKNWFKWKWIKIGVWLCVFKIIKFMECFFLFSIAFSHYHSSYQKYFPVSTDFIKQLISIQPDTNSRISN